MDSQRVAFRRAKIGFFSRINQPGGPSEQISRQTYKTLHIEIKLGAEPAARRGLNDAHPVLFESQQIGQILLVVVRVLRRGVNIENTGGVHISQAGVRLEVSVLYVWSSINPIYDEIRFFKRGLGIASLGNPPAQEITLFMDFHGAGSQRFFRIEDRGEVLIDDADDS